ncbi:hypothetical protein BT96DRAFT_640640 [Gymnopus androsaceus JB14]|uniref:Uncharacterized protein n=1 Tax=Gymnopus androsaceus JB14 TaxID=1447944 RepID=A0A6A4GGR0_9AGAR|nr:hypothetical protein BT96DRAFT_640640 [Gymnopus androsaceus JB14]
MHGNLKQTAGLFEINARLAHASLAKVCIIYLLKSTNGSYFRQLKEWEVQHKSPTYYYAAKYWGAHTKLVQEAGHETDLDGLTRDFLKKNAPFETWATIIDLRYNGDIASPLYYAAKYGLIRSAQDLILSSECDINAQEGEFGNALQGAASKGNEAIVQLLLTHEADVNAQGGYYGNALQAAAFNWK